MQTFSHIKHKTEKIGLALLICGFMLSATWLVVSNKNLSGYSELINHAGQQRMLSQKLAYLAQISSSTPELSPRLYDTLDRLSNNSQIIIGLLQQKNNLPNKQILIQTSQQLVDDYQQLINAADDSSKSMSTFELFEQSQIALAKFEQKVVKLQYAATAAEKTFTRAVIGSFCFIVFIVWYFFQMLVKPKLIADKKALFEYSESLTIYKRLFEDSKDSVLIFDSNWQLVNANQSSFTQIQQRNQSLIMANRFWLNNTFKHVKRDMAKQLNEHGSWADTIELNSPAQKQRFMSVSAFKIAGLHNLDSFYAVTLKDITALQNKQQETERLAQTDSLTDTLNRSAILKKLADVCINVPSKDEMTGVLFVDLNGFKHVNDVYGHTTGDKILKQISLRLSDLVTAKTTLARLGGDEFLFVCENVDSINYFESFANQINAIFSTPLLVEGMTIRLGVSIGVSLYPQHSLQATELVQFADIAMYHSKNSGLNGYTLFEPQMLQSIVDNNNIEVHLRQAVAKAELRQVYQPIINLGNIQTIGAELLMRWTSEELGAVFPDVFIPIAEKLECIYEIDNWSFNTMLKAVKDRGWVGYVSINLSSLHFRNTEIIERFLTRLSEANLPNQFLFEVTETALIDNIEQSAIVIKKIKAAGFSVAIDDFGTGYTSLYYLKILPFDYIKIDRSFISDMCENENSYSIVQAIIRLAKDLNIQVIAEGVETQEIESELKKLGCDYAQGYLYEKPIPFDELTQNFALATDALKANDL